MSLADELHKIIREEQLNKAEEARRIDAFFPQPAPHVLQLDENPSPATNSVPEAINLKM